MASDYGKIPFKELSYSEIKHLLDLSMKFFPDFFGIEEPPAGGEPFERFTEDIRKIPGLIDKSDNIGVAILRIRNREEELRQSSNIPTKEQLEIAEREREKREAETKEAEAKAKEEQRKFEEMQEKIRGKKEIQIKPTSVEYVVPKVAPVPQKVQERTIKIIEGIKKDPSSFAESLVTYASQPEHKIEGTSQQTTKLIATMAAQEIVAEKIPQITYDTQKAVATPALNRVSAELAKVSDVIKTTPPGSQTVRLTTAIVANDIVLQEAERTLVSGFFKDQGGEITNILYGNPDQEFEVVIEPPQTSQFFTSYPYFQEQQIEAISRIDELPQEVVTQNIFNNLSESISFPTPDLNEFSRNIVNTLQGLAKQFGGHGAEETPSFDGSSARNFLTIAKELNFVTPEVAALFQDYTLVEIPFSGFAPFGTELVAPGTINLNFGFGGLSFGYTPAAAGGGAAAVGETAAVGATTAAGETAAVGAAATAGGTAATAAAAAGETAVVAGETAALGATGAAGGAAVGSAVPIIGTIIGALVGLVAASLPAIKKFIEEHKEDLTALFIGGGIFGLMIGNVFVSLWGLGIGVPLAIYSGVTPANFLASITSAFGALFTIAILPEIKKPLIGFLLGFPVLLALILFIINSGAYVVPPGASSFSAGGTATGETISCNGTVAGQFATGCSGLSQNAETIANSLQPGFWQYFNKSCIYPELFDDAYYATNPVPCVNGTPNNPNGCTGDSTGVNMFWCTWLIIKSYKEAGYNMAASVDGYNMLYVPDMINWFKKEARFKGADTPASQLPAGTAIFFLGSGGTGHHVGMIIKNTQYYVTMAQSNGAGNFETFIVKNDHIIGNTDQNPIAGFGMPPSQCQ